MAAKIFWFINLISFLLICQTIYGQTAPKGGDTAMGTGLWLLLLLAVFVTTLAGLTLALAWRGNFDWISVNGFARWLGVLSTLLTLIGAISAAILTQENVNSLAQNGGWLSLAFRFIPLLLLAAYGIWLWGTSQSYLFAVARWLCAASWLLSLAVGVVLMPKLLK